MSLRLFALGGAVVCAIVLPLAMASAGSVGDEKEFVVGPLPLADDGVTDDRAGAGDTGDGRGLLGGAGSGAGVAGGGRSGAGGVGDGSPSDGRAGAGRAGDGRAGAGPAGVYGHDDARPPGAEPSGSPRLLGLGLATAARCGPELTSPDGVEAQTCVLTQGEDTWARTYYRNSTGRALSAVLSFMGPHGRTVQIRCAVGADDEPGACETPRERSQGDPTAYTAIAEFAGAAGASGSAGSADGGPLLLRSGSNSAPDTGS